MGLVFRKVIPGQRHFMVPDHYQDLSNEVQYDILSQGASKLPEVKNLDMCNLLYKRGFLWNF